MFGMLGVVLKTIPAVSTTSGSAPRSSAVDAGSSAAPDGAAAWVPTGAVVLGADVVPAVAVQSGQQGDYVFVVKPDQSVEYRKVTIERTVDSNTVIRQGLTPGEMVVTDGQLRLTAGTRVTIKDGKGAGAGAAP